MLGTYGFDANGDTTLKSYGLYKVGKDGNPVFERDGHAVARRQADRGRAAGHGRPAPVSRL